MNVFSLRAIAAAYTLPPVVIAARPRQWTKNVVLFAGLVFARRLGEAESWLAAASVFWAYCAVSSAAYLVNDVRDAEDDRRHPAKRSRPVASGELPPRQALFAAGILAVLGMTVAAVLGPLSVALLACFAGIQALYSLRLKRFVFVDVLTIAGLFVLRAAAGAVAVQVRISPWLLACTALLALFLVLAKRRAELVLVAGARAPGRPVLEKYSPILVERLVWVTAAAAAVVYTLYALTARDSQAMVLTVPLVVAGLARYLFLIQRRDLGEEPEQVLLTDGVTLACVGCWVVTAIIALSLS